VHFAKDAQVSGFAFRPKHAKVWAEKFVMIKPTHNWQSRAVSAADAVAGIKSGDNVFIHGAAATPTALIEALCARSDLENVRVYHLHTNGPAPFAAPERSKEFHSVSLFTGSPLRGADNEGRADFVPIFLSDIPALFLSGQVKLDAVFLQLSVPDAHGLCSLGTSCDAAKAAAETARLVIVEFNEQMPRTHGNNLVPFSRIDSYIHTNHPLLGHHIKAESVVEGQIGEFVANLVEDGSTLQMGIGGIPDAALSRMKEKRELGVHTEMFSDRIVDLVEAGAITNEHKKVGQGRIVTSFINGSQRLFDFVNDNPQVAFHSCD
jgi:4-hydroxybutyrate CoA-transferase